MTLCVESEFRASHSLEQFEAPHFHVWKIAVEFRASLPLKTDRVIDLVFLQKTLQKIHQPLENAHLNEVLSVSPTSENLALWVWDELSKAKLSAALHSVKITLCNLEGEATGYAQVHA
jgi:6-pyruvoyl-tetrahydropterin synthase